MEILRECHGLYQYYNKTWNSYLNFCLLKIVVLLSNHENHLQTIFLPKNIAYLLSYAFLFIAIANSTVFNLKLTVSCAIVLKCFQFSQYVRKVFILLKIFIIRKMNTKYFSPVRYYDFSLRFLVRYLRYYSLLSFNPKKFNSLRYLTHSVISL